MSRLNEELKIRISPEDKERIKLKMENAGILTMSAYMNFGLFAFFSVRRLLLCYHLNFLLWLEVINDGLMFL